MNEIDEIRSQMAQIRHDLHQDVSSVVSSVSDVVHDVTEVMDWKSVLRGHPYFLVGSALLAGYLIIPRRKRLTQPAQSLLAGTVTADVPVAPRKRFRPLSSAVDLLWPIATQAVQAYAMIWIENRLKQYMHMAPDPNESERPYADPFQRPSAGYLR